MTQIDNDSRYIPHSKMADLYRTYRGSTSAFFLDRSDEGTTVINGGDILELQRGFIGKAYN